MEKVTSKLLVCSASLMVLGLASACSTDSLEDAGSSILDNTTKVNAEIGTDMDQTRVVMWKTANNADNAKMLAGMTRATALTMPAEPTIPSGAEDMSDGKYKNWQVDSSKPYYVPTGKSCELSINLASTTYYVAGNLTITNMWNEGTIYVLQGGSLTLKQGTLDNVTIYNYGTLTTGEDLVINDKASLYTTKDISLKSINPNGTFYCGGNVTTTGNFNPNQTGVISIEGDINVGGNLNVSGSKIYCGGNVTAPYLNANNSCDITIEGSLDLDDDNEKGKKDRSEVTNNAVITVGGKLTAEDLQLNSSANVTVNCAMEVEDLDITNGAKLNVAYLKADDVTFSSSPTITVMAGGVLEFDELSIGNTPNQWSPTPLITVKEVTGKTYAQLNVKEMNFTDVNNGDGIIDATYAFTGFLGIQCEKMLAGGSKEMTKFSKQENVKLLGEGEDMVKVTTGNSCVPYEVPGTDDPVIDPVGEIHTHDISATCVQKVGNNLYISYHQRGNGQSGCIEVAGINGNDIMLKGYMRSEDIYDFNHLIVDQTASPNRLYAVGNQILGGAMTYIDLDNDGLFQSVNGMEQTSDPDKKITTTGLYVRRLLGGDGNCLVRNGNMLQVATTYGVENYNPETMERVFRSATAGSCKHIDMDGTYLATLNLDQRGSGEATNEDGTTNENYLQESPATLKLYDKSDTEYANPKWTVTVPRITPTNGKNVVKVKDGRVYVCTGQDGIYVYDCGTGEQVGHWQATKKDGVTPVNAYANGCDVDDKYVYVANGGTGIYILDKETLKELYHASSDTGRSANYIRVDGDNLYVAYGKGDLQAADVDNDAKVSVFRVLNREIK